MSAGLKQLLGLSSVTVCIVMLLLSAGVRLSAQDIDRVLYAGERPPPTLLDQIEDPEERELVRAMVDETDSAAKARIGAQFLERYPASSFLVQGHTLMALASIDIGDLDAALEHGRMSLRLRPENGALLASMANVQVQKGLLDDAVHSAEQALRFLGDFHGPARYTDSEWQVMRTQLEARSHFVLGRVAATRGLGDKGSRRTDALVEARRHLTDSLRLDDQDGIAWHLLGIVEDGLGHGQRAVEAHAASARLVGPVQRRALDAVRRHWSATGEPTRDGFDEFLAGVPTRSIEPEASGGRSDAESEPPAYAGSAVCRECHEEAFSAWQQTGMANMVRPYSPDIVMGDFTDNNEYREGNGPVLARMRLSNGQHYIELESGGTFKEFPVDYVIGSKWQQAYATRLDDGRIHVVPIQYNQLHDQWVNFWEILDDGKSERTIVQDFHQFKNVTNYQVNCASCHTSQAHAEGGVLAAERITFRETGINCEMCHGPSLAHTVNYRSETPLPRTDPHETPLRFSEIDSRSYVAVCAQCHMQSGILEIGKQGELNFTGEQTAFYQFRKKRPYDEFSLKAFYKDGRFRETTFIVESFERSKCFLDGQAHCGDCHDPHPADASENTKSLKFRSNENRMCLQCHVGIEADLTAHTRHDPGTPASECASCHMPKIMNSMMFMARTHRIDDIPAAAMTARFGRQESPNACLVCHAEESDDWLAEELARWTSPVALVNAKDEPAIASTGVRWVRRTGPRSVRPTQIEARRSGQSPQPPRPRL